MPLFSYQLEGQVQIDQAAKLAFEFLLGWRVSNISGQSAPVSEPPSWWYFSSLNLSRTSHVTTVSIASHPVTVHLQEEFGSGFSISSNQIAAASTEVTPEPSFLQAVQTWLAQPLSVAPLKGAQSGS